MVGTLHKLAQLATECVQQGLNDQALLHLGMLEMQLAKLQPVGSVDVAPVLNASLGFLDIPLPTGTVIFAVVNE